ncbi:MAG: Rieske (2Fe-2S) protein [Thermomicrobiales bacterium]|nr:Rieske (2Fe-2S) protein [Thermomicrobiales bacterium]
MNPLLRTVAGLGTGWVAARGMAVASRLQATHGEAAAAKVSDRRSFTRNAALGASAVVLANLGVAFGMLMWPNKTGDFGSDITVSAGNIPEPGATPFRNQAGKFYIVRNEDGIQALYWKCVHLGCTVPWNAGENDFHCPCHGSIFNIDGARTGGPATRRLDRMPIVVNGDGSITVTTNPTMIEAASGRTDYLPTDATPYP